MRLLADENFPRSIVESLRSGGHDVLWALTECRGCKDVDLLERAENEARVVLTMDKDFWQIAMQRRVGLERSGVVLFKAHPATAKTLAPLVRLFLDSEATWKGHVCIISATGVQTLSVRKN